MKSLLSRIFPARVKIPRYIKNMTYDERLANAAANAMRTRQISALGNRGRLQGEMVSHLYGRPR